MENKPSDHISNNPTQFNIAAIAKLEEEALDRRTRTERQSVDPNAVGKKERIVAYIKCVAAALKRLEAGRDVLRSAEFEFGNPRSSARQGGVGAQAAGPRRT